MGLDGKTANSMLSVACMGSAHIADLHCRQRLMSTKVVARATTAMHKCVRTNNLHVSDTMCCWADHTQVQGCLVADSLPSIALQHLTRVWPTLAAIPPQFLPVEVRRDLTRCWTLALHTKPAMCEPVIGSMADFAVRNFALPGGERGAQTLAAALEELVCSHQAAQALGSALLGLSQLPEVKVLSQWRAGDAEPDTAQVVAMDKAVHSIVLNLDRHPEPHDTSNVSIPDIYLDRILCETTNQMIMRPASGLPSRRVDRRQSWC